MRWSLRRPAPATWWAAAWGLASAGALIAFHLVVTGIRPSPVALLALVLTSTAVCVVFRPGVAAGVGAEAIALQVALHSWLKPPSTSCLKTASGCGSAAAELDTATALIHLTVLGIVLTTVEVLRRLARFGRLRPRRRSFAQVVLAPSSRMASLAALPRSRRIERRLAEWLRVSPDRGPPLRAFAHA